MVKKESMLDHSCKVSFDYLKRHFTTKMYFCRNIFRPIRAKTYHWPFSSKLRSLGILLCVALCPFWFCSHLDGKERAGCFALFVFLVSCGCFVALPHDAMGLSAVLSSVVFPAHTHLLFF